MRKKKEQNISNLSLLAAKMLEDYSYPEHFRVVLKAGVHIHATLGDTSDVKVCAKDILIRIRLLGGIQPFENTLHHSLRIETKQL